MKQQNGRDDSMMPQQAGSSRGNMQQQLGNSHGSMNQQLGNSHGNMQEQVDSNHGNMQQQAGSSRGNMQQQAGNNHGNMQEQVNSNHGNMQQQADSIQQRMSKILKCEQKVKDGFETVRRNADSLTDNWQIDEENSSDLTFAVHICECSIAILEYGESLIHQSDDLFEYISEIHDVLKEYYSDVILLQDLVIHLSQEADSISTSVDLSVKVSVADMIEFKNICLIVQKRINNAQNLVRSHGIEELAPTAKSYQNEFDVNVGAFNKHLKDMRIRLERHPPTGLAPDLLKLAKCCPPKVGDYLLSQMAKRQAVIEAATYNLPRLIQDNLTTINAYWKNVNAVWDKLYNY